MNEFQLQQQLQNNLNSALQPVTNFLWGMWLLYAIVVLTGVAFMITIILILKKHFLDPKKEGHLSIRERPESLKEVTERLKKIGRDN